MLSPRYCRTEPGPSHRGQEGQQEPFAAAFVVLPYPSPGRGITASRWRFGMVSRCSAYGEQGQPGTSGREGDKSVEAVPRPWLTFNLAQMHRGVDKIRPRSAGYPFPGSQYPPPREPSVIRPTGGFRFVGQRIQFRDYLAIFSIASICISKTRQSTLRGSFRSDLRGPGASLNRIAQPIGNRAHWVASISLDSRFEVIFAASLAPARHGAFSTHQHGPAARARRPTGPR